VVLAVVIGCAALGRSAGEALRLSVVFVGYTNLPSGEHVGVLQISNASPFAVVRGRSPVVQFDRMFMRQLQAPAGWRLLAVGESERVLTEPLTRGPRWRLSVVGEPSGYDSYGVGEEPFHRKCGRFIASITDSHRLVTLLCPPRGRLFSGDWIDGQ
jgi:hypothetical protein